MKIKSILIGGLHFFILTIPLVAFAAPNGASQDWVKQYMVSQMAPTTYHVGESAQEEERLFLPRMEVFMALL